MSIEYLYMKLFFIGILITFAIKKFSEWYLIHIPSPPQMLTIFRQVLLSKLSSAQAARVLYLPMKSRGHRFFRAMLIFPSIVVIHPELLKDILVKEFNSFVDRKSYVNEKDDPISANLITLQGTKWRNIRATITPSLSTNRFKVIIDAVLEKCIQLKSVLDEFNESDALDVKEIMARFNIDIIMSCAFGLGSNCLKDGNNDFSTQGLKAFQANVASSFKRMITNCFPSIGRMMRVKITPDDISIFFLNLINDTIEYREKNNVNSNDFLHLLMQMKNRSVMDGKDLHGSQNLKGSFTMTNSEITAQSHMFFTSSFEQSSLIISYALYELASNPDIQKRVRDEIVDVLAKYNDELCYEAISDMKYLSMVVDETLRKYPVVPLITRVCNADYTIPGTTIIAKKGTAFIIPIEALHHDPDIYPNPERFDPERFSDDNKEKLNPFCYLPFGKGPRGCIGTRFGLLQIKVGIITFIRNFVVQLDSQTQVPLVRDPTFFLSQWLTKSCSIFVLLEMKRQIKFM